MTLTIILAAITLVWLCAFAYRYWETLRDQGHDLARYTDGGRIFMRDGKVVCFGCKSTDTVTRKVVGPSHIRRHYCVNCGLGLFYSSVREERASDPMRFPSMNPKS